MKVTGIEIKEMELKKNVWRSSNGIVWISCALLSARGDEFRVGKIVFFVHMFNKKLNWLGEVFVLEITLKQIDSHTHTWFSVLAGKKSREICYLKSEIHYVNYYNESNLILQDNFKRWNITYEFLWNNTNFSIVFSKNSWNLHDEK